ncbi:MAG: hypothetical protein KDD69_02975 [Bdellovibrionales bacterium]|nr:hypothetical protein [Bdellovibrionales bacterium]
MVAAIVMITATGIALALLCFGANGLRGTDQYWYTAEVEQLLAGQRNIGTVAFPFHAYHQLIPPPFNHHTPTHYVVLPFAALWGALWGWNIVNFLCSFLVAALIGVGVARCTDLRAGALAYAVTILLPLQVWVATQQYLESSLALLVTVGLFIFSFQPHGARKWFSLLVVFLIAYCCRASFLPALLLIPLGYIAYSRPLSRKTLGIGIGMLLLALGGLAGYQHYFSPDPALTFTRYMSAYVPNVSNSMEVLYFLEDPALNPQHLLAKAQRGLWNQFFRKASMQVFYLPFNMLALLTLWGLWRYRSRYPQGFPIAALVLVFLHLLTICLRANDFRFLQVVSPVVLMGALIAVGSSSLLRHRTRWIGIAALALVSLTSVDIILIRKIQRDVARDASNRAALSHFLDNAIPRTDPVIVATSHYSNKEFLLSYAVRPRLVLFTGPNHGYSAEEHLAMRKAVKGKWLLAEPDSPLISIFKAEAAQETTAPLPEPYERLHVYRLPEATA